MPLAKTKSKVEDKPSMATMLVYGEPGIGKTTMASQVDGAYFLATEPGHKFKEVFKSDCTSWDEFCNEVRLLLNEKHEFKTVVIDTVSAAWDMCISEMCKKQGWNHISEPAMGRGYDLAKSWFRPVINALYQSNLGLIMIAHDTEREAEYRGIKKHRTVPQIIKTCRDTILPMCDFIGHMYVENVMTGAKMEGRRFITFSPNAEKDCKDRSNILASHGPIMVEPESMCWARVRDLFKPKTEKVKAGET